MAQGVGKCLMICLYGGMDVKMNGCVLDEGCVEMGVNDLTKYELNLCYTHFLL